MALTRIRVLALALLAVGCRSELSAPPTERATEVGPVVFTDRPTYSSARDKTLTWSVTNPQAVSAFYYPAAPVFLEHYVSGRWEDIGLYGGFGATSARLASADTVHDTLSLSSPDFSVAGWYRIQASVFEDSALTQPWPLANRVSPAVWVGP